MRYLRRFCLGCCVLLSPTLMFALTAKQALQSHLQAIQTWKAQFTQVVRDASGLVISSARGWCQLKKPGYFYWKTLSPVKQTLVLGNNTLWIIDHDLQQATERRLQESNLVSNPLYVLITGSTRPLRRYHVQQDHDTFTLTPLVEPGGSVAFNTMTFNFEQNQLSSIIVKDTLQQTTRFRFRNIQQNLPLDAKLFFYVPEPGMSVVKE